MSSLLLLSTPRFCPVWKQAEPKAQRSGGVSGSAESCGRRGPAAEGRGRTSGAAAQSCARCSLREAAWASGLGEIGGSRSCVHSEGTLFLIHTKLLCGLCLPLGNPTPSEPRRGRDAREQGCKRTGRVGVGPQAQETDPQLGEGTCHCAKGW